MQQAGEMKINYLFDNTDYISLLEENKIVKTPIDGFIDAESMEGIRVKISSHTNRELLKNLDTLIEKYPKNITKKDDAIYITVHPETIKDAKSSFSIDGVFNEEGKPTQRAYGITIDRPEHTGRTTITKAIASTDRGDTL